MTFKVDSHIVPDTPLKVMDIPDNVEFTIESVGNNTADIFISNSSANVQANNKRASIAPGKGRTFLGTSDDQLWVMAEDNTEPEIVVFCANQIRDLGATFDSGIVPAAPVAPAIAGHWGSAATNGNDFSHTGISVNANNKYWIAIALEDGGTIDSVTGMGLTWNWEEEANNSGQVQLFLYRGDGTPTGTGTVDVNISGAQSRASMVVSVSGADPTTPTIDDDPKTGNGTSVSGVATNVELDGLFLGWIAEDNNRTFTPGGGNSFVVKHGAASDVALHLVQFSPTAPGTRNISGTMNGSADWATITHGIRKAP